MPSKIGLASGQLKASEFFPLRQRSVCLRCLRNQERGYATERYTHHWREAAKNPQEESLRRRFESWMNGPGTAFRRPLPGSTNYLNAYNKKGGLIRQDARDKENDAPKKDGKQDQANAEEQELVDEEKTRREERDKDLKEAATDAPSLQAKSIKPPPETAEDLRPFPLNRFFVSERVLSEELREMLYVHVSERGRSIRQVSADFKVSMERVAAVVRMKQMERDWLAKVSAAPFPPHVALS